jgi:hypothetical protein
MYLFLYFSKQAIWCLQWIVYLTICLAGQNGTIDGQGKMWWDLWWNRTLEHTRGHLVELMNSHNILISNLTFLNSPFWTIHPVYCRFNVPKHSPNMLFLFLLYMILCLPEMLLISKVIYSSNITIHDCASSLFAFFI